MRAERDLKLLEKEMKVLQKADGMIKIEEGKKRGIYKPIQNKHKHRNKQSAMENAIESMFQPQHSQGSVPLHNERFWNEP